MNPFETLDAEVSADLQFDILRADEIAMKIPKLKQKYARKLVEAEIKVKSTEQDLFELKKELHNYYLFDYQTKIDRRDVDLYIEGDQKYVKLMRVLTVQRETAKYLENILKSIDSMQYMLPAAVKWHIFKNGG